MKQWLIIAALGLSTVPALAQTAFSPPNAQNGNFGPQHQQQFEQRKAAEMASHQQRIQILQSADACVRSAATPDAFRRCESVEREQRQAFHEQQQREHQQMRAQREQMRAQHEAMRAQRMQMAQNNTQFH